MEKVYKDKNNCCGCGACKAVCPQKAITMQKDKYGFLYPYIDKKKCINCGLCEKNCAYSKNNEGDYPIYTNAAQSKSVQELQKSASGGIAACIANEFLTGGGVVCGCVMEFEDGKADVHHLLVEKRDDLWKLQGSKYVQSHIDCYDKMLELLKEGRMLLFIGTPCQVAEIRFYFKKYINQLLCIDIVCHGTPSCQMFNDYLKCKWNQDKIVDFTFRDKKYGWGKTGSVKYLRKNKEIKEKKVRCKDSSFYELFMESEISRECCYSCHYTTLKRNGDITLGDYWGVEEFNPELLKKGGGLLDEKQGISCVLINTEKGYDFLKQISDKILVENIDLNSVLVYNHQLRQPPQHTNMRETVKKLYVSIGYRSIEGLFLIRKFVWWTKGKCKIIYHKVGKSMRGN